MKNDIQSRREFFRNASRVTLPILGISLMPNLSILKEAVKPSGCEGCTGICTGCQGCEGSCSGSCGGNCSQTCGGTGKS